MDETMSLFTELKPSEEASLSGGKSDHIKLPKTLIIIDGNITGAGGGAATGGAVGGSSGTATAGSGVSITVK